MPEETVLKGQREKCWASRDIYWACLDEKGEASKVCAKLRKDYESVCPATWVRHFDRKRKYEAFQVELKKEESRANDELKRMPEFRKPQDPSAS